MAVWAHPLDVHYSIKGIDGWPRLYVEVWGIDGLGRYEIAGYGCCIVPTSPGLHELTCRTWRPHGSMREQISSALPPPARRLSTPLACSDSGVPAPSQLSSWVACRHSSTRKSLSRRPTAFACRPNHPARCSCPATHEPLVLHTPHAHRALSRRQVQVRLAVVTKDFARYGVSC
jgi:hypothetical protein